MNLFHTHPSSPKLRTKTKNVKPVISVCSSCAPSISLLTVNAVAFVDEIFVPVSMEMLAMIGARHFFQYLRQVSRQLGRVASIRLIIPTFYDPRRRVSDYILQTLINDFGTRVTQPIRVDTKLSEAPGVGQTIYEYAPRSAGAEDYSRLTERILRDDGP